MSNELQSISQLFQNRLFRIPDYQRGYAWKREQLADFWDDLTNLQMDRYHYTGLLSLKAVPRSSTKSWLNDAWMLDTGFRPYHVVDGQQRLTTIAILMNEIVTFVKGIEENSSKADEEIILGYETLKDIRAKYISRKRPPQYIITSYLFGYETDNPSADYLQYRVFGEPFSGSVEKTYYTKNLEYAKEFFADCLEKMYHSEGIAGIELLYKKLTLKLMFNIHEIEDDYDVFVAFETMNNRGKKLTNLELLKNRLIYLTTLFDDAKLDISDKAALRNKINDAWKEVYYQLGRNQSISLSDDEFLRAHWTLFFQYSRKKGDDYIKFLLNRFSAKNIFEKQTSSLPDETTEEIADSDAEIDESEPVDSESDISAVSRLEPKEIDAYVMSLKETSKYWYYTFFPYESDLTAEEKLCIDRLNRIGIGYFRPMITATLTPSANTTSAERVALFKEIERFIFICFRLGTFQSSYRSSDCYHKAKEIYSCEASVADVTREISNTATADATYAINNFITKIDKKFTSGEGFYGWRDLRYMLYEYEYSLAVQNNLQKVDWSMFTKVEKDKISVEHILPQTPTKWYWRNQFRQYSADEIKISSCSLGNLLPLSQSINSGLQNDGFHDKKTTAVSGRRGYENGSHSEIEVSKEAEWDAYRILQRGIKLLKFMETRWQFQFENEAQMFDLLHLNFLLEQRDIPDEMPPEQPRQGLSSSVPPVSSQMRMQSDTGSFQMAFWTQFVEYCKSIGRGGDIAARKPHPQNWYDISIGTSEYVMFLGILGNSTLRIGLYVNHIDSFKRLEANKAEIERSCGFNLDWYSSREKSTEKRILYSITTNIQAEENWGFCFDWLIEHFDRLVTALHTYDLPAKQAGSLSAKTR